jgi:hypothetical protein
MALNTAFAVLLTASAALAAPIEPVVSRRGNLPTPVSVTTARTYLSQLTVEAENNSPAYDRDLFNHWITISGTCNARETVLKRDGSNVVTSSACAATSGSWYSDYDGFTFTVSSEVDIDHLVPLVSLKLALRLRHMLISDQKEAWVSGARTWTDARREAFANEYVPLPISLGICSID